MSCEITTGEPLGIPMPTTGERLAGLPVGGLCDPIPDPCVKFDLNSDVDTSAVFTVTEPMEMLAFGLEHPDYVELEQVWGPNEGTHFEAVTVGGQCFRLSPCSNRLLIPFAGRFRLRYVGDVGNATVVCNPTDCCFATIHPKDANMACEPPLTNVQIAQMLAFRKCDGGAVTPGESLATCGDILALDARVDAHDTAIAGLGTRVTVLENATAPAGYSLVDMQGALIPSGGCVSTCADTVRELAELDTAIRADMGVGLDFNSGTNVLTLQNDAGMTLDSVSLASLAGGGGGGTDGVVTNVVRSGTDLVFSGTGGGFNGTVSLAGLGGGGGSDGVVTGVVLTGTDLVFTGTGGGFNGSVSLAALAGGGGGGAGDVTGVTASGPLVATSSGGPVPNIALDVDALVAALCANQDFAVCLANKILTVFQQTGNELVIASGVAANGDFTFTPCP